MSAPPEPAPLDATQPPYDGAVGPSVPPGWPARLRRVAPWLSLALGIGAAWWTVREPRRASWICAMAVVAWLALIGWRALEPALARPDARRRVRWAALGLQAASQSAAQSLLFFSLPWLWRAATPTLAQALYLGLLAATAAATLWDPLWQRLTARRTVAAWLLAAATFGSLAATLPMLGVDLDAARWIAAGGAAVPAAWQVLGGGRAREPARWTLAQVAALPWIFFAGPWREAVPPAPLHLARAALATGVRDRQPAGAFDPDHPGPHAWCFTAVAAPTGVRTTIVHRWWRDDVELSHHSLAVQGGRKGGYRTWSRMAGSRLRGGQVRCEVRTVGGQWLGEVRRSPGDG